MKQRFIDDLQKTANTIQNACAKLSQLNELRQKFHGGETLKLTLTFRNVGSCTPKSLSRNGL